MTPLCWWIFWVGFWADLARLDRQTAEIISFADWKRAHPPSDRPGGPADVPPQSNGRAA